MWAGTDRAVSDIVARGGGYPRDFPASRTSAGSGAQVGLGRELARVLEEEGGHWTIGRDCERWEGVGSGAQGALFQNLKVFPREAKE